MPIDFPNSPTVGQTFTSGVRTWIWNGSVWNVQNYGPQGPQGTQGAQGVTGRFTQASVPPTSPVAGDVWFNIETGETFVYYDSFWTAWAQGAQGVQGVQGFQGVQGAQGAQGNTGVNTPLVASVTLGATDVTKSGQSYSLISGFATGTFTATSGRKYLILAQFAAQQFAASGSNTISFALYRNNGGADTLIADMPYGILAASDTVAFAYNYLWTPASTFTGVSVQLWGKSSHATDSYIIKSSNSACQITVLDVGT